MAEQLHFHFSLLCIGEGNGNPLQCSCLENPRDRGAWWAAIYGVAQSQTRLKQLSSSSSSSSLLPCLGPTSYLHAGCPTCTCPNGTSISRFTYPGKSSLLLQCTCLFLLSFHIIEYHGGCLQFHLIESHLLPIKLSFLYTQMPAGVGLADIHIHINAWVVWGVRKWGEVCNWK